MVMFWPSKTGEVGLIGPTDPTEPVGDDTKCAADATGATESGSFSKTDGGSRWRKAGGDEPDVSFASELLLGEAALLLPLDASVPHADGPDGNRLLTKPRPAAPPGSARGIWAGDADGVLDGVISLENLWRTRVISRILTGLGKKSSIPAARQLARTVSHASAVKPTITGLLRPHASHMARMR